jgi:hypothetical protein
MTGHSDVLRANASRYARIAIDNIRREFPSDVHTLMRAPGDIPYRPRDRTPVFFGSYDWHSCVEMHWTLVRLLKVGVGPAGEIRDCLDDQFTDEGLRAEAEFMAHPYHGNKQRPYGWGWALALAHELDTWDDPDGRRWTAQMRPLADTVTTNFLRWLAKATYPGRYGVHSNSAFGLSRAWEHARTRPDLKAGIEAVAHRWFAGDADYPAGWEPSGADFLSPALAEAELMAKLLPPDRYAAWLDAFLPGITDGRPASLFTPAIVSESGDGQIAHLHGLNASRAWCWRRIADSLPPGDRRIPVARAAQRTHTDAALPHVVGSHYTVEHWLVCYAVLLLS